VLLQLHFAWRVLLFTHSEGVKKQRLIRQRLNVLIVKNNNDLVVKNTLNEAGFNWSEFLMTSQQAFNQICANDLEISVAL